MKYVVLIVCAAGLAFGFQSGSGTSEDPYIISNTEELLEVNSDLSACYKLSTDLSLSEASPAILAPDTAPEDSSFTGEAFTGIIFGSGHTISGADISADSQYYCGLFGFIEEGGQVLNLRVRGSLTASGTVGYAGLIAGRNKGVISGCSVNADLSLSTQTSYTGFITGSNEGSIMRCRSEGSCLGGMQNIGGIAGYSTSDAAFADCLSRAVFDLSENPNYVGGISGYCFSDISNSFYNGSFQNSAHADKFGSITGKANDASITGCRWSESAGCQSYTGESHSTNPQNTFMLEESELGIRASYAGWDILRESVNGVSEIWRITPQGAKLYHSGIFEDFNKDGAVDIKDFAILAQYFPINHQSQTGLAVPCDGNFDGLLNSSDLIDFAESWLTGE
ncbi:hypothetical protein [Sedimentisphaera salicampi]|uniref:hypothetical protein n=1 Tax=Sedimentisphaera salicampi TaxID=1941349 RepID=UPI000B9AC65B|nr:hypothetical protein [Sedimentisphaera salicampi]OXU15510.1 hypothetical protein SMSP1_00995 [Sedimentisphaera salicampi]